MRGVTLFAVHLTPHLHQEGPAALRVQYIKSTIKNPLQTVIMGSCSPVSRRSSTMFGIHSENKALQELQRVQTQNRRFSLIAGAFIFLLVISLICLVVLDLYTNAAIVTGQNRTRHPAGHLIEHLDDLMAAQRWEAAQDVLLEPQHEAERRWGHEGEGAMGEAEGILLGQDGIGVHPNHRYTEEPVDLPEERTGWKPRPFTLSVGNQNTSINSLVDMHSHLGHSPQLHSPHLDYEPPATIVSQPEQPIDKPDMDFGTPVRFRGVYVHPKLMTLHPAETNGDRSRDEQYYRKINELFTRNREGSRKEPRGSIKHGRKQTPPNDSEGAASIHYQQSEPELYTKAIFPSHEMLPAEAGGDASKPWNRKKGRPRRKPFTVMLDIYPMNQDDPTQPRPYRSPQGLRDDRGTIYIPLRPGEHAYSPGLAGARFFPSKPRGQNSRMLMKLNLFPREGKTPDGTNRRTWGLFKKLKKKKKEKEEEEEDEDEDEENCPNVVGHNPYGAPITAMWKDAHGQIIHAKFVTLRQWDEDWEDRMDSDVHPR